MLQIRTILHPTDFSTNADYAWHVACSLAQQYGAKLLLLNVHRQILAPMGEFGMPPPDLSSSRETAEKKIAAIQPTISSLKVHRFVTEGEGAEEIIAFAKENDCDLIVMGTHGHRGLRRILMGSVAEQVVRDSPCAVLTLKNPMAEVETGFTTEAVEVAS